MRPTVLAAAILMLATTAAPALAAPTPFLVDTCGEIVPPKAAAYLAADLDCSGSSAMSAVELGKKASLDLGGFTITTGSQYGIRCDFGKCVIRNGTVTGAAVAGIVAVKSTLTDITVTTSGTFGIALNGRSTLRNATIAGTGTVGVYESGSKGKLLFVDSTVSGHARFGVWAYKVELKNSTVTGNMNDPECAEDALCADLLTLRRPTIKSSTCGRSDHLGDEPTFPGCLGWCVCTDD